MFFIPIDSSSHQIQCDEQDYRLLSAYRWRILQNNHHIYARATIDGERLLAHRLIMGKEIGLGMVVDHINGNGLDNRRSNLRVVTAKENNWNRNKTNAVSGIAGVYFTNGRYHGKFVNDGKSIYIGAYDTIEEAAFMLMQKKIELRGEFASVISFDKEKLKKHWLQKIQEIQEQIMKLEKL